MPGFNLRKRVCAISQYNGFNAVIYIINKLFCIKNSVNNDNHVKLTENICLFLDAFDAHVQKINKRYDNFYIKKSIRKRLGFEPKKDMFNNKKYTYISQLVKTKTHIPLIYTENIPWYLDKIVLAYDDLFESTAKLIAVICADKFNIIAENYHEQLMFTTNEIINSTIYDIFKGLSLLQQGEYISAMYLKRRCGNDITRHIMKYVAYTL